MRISTMIFVKKTATDYFKYDEDLSKKKLTDKRKKLI